MKYECVKDIKYWMTCHIFFYSDKTELLLIGPKTCTQNLRIQFAFRRMYCYFILCN